MNYTAVMPAAKSGAELENALSLPHFAELARDCITPAAWARLEGGAADEVTLRWNCEAYQQIRLRPRVLVDVSKLDTRRDSVWPGVAVSHLAFAHRSAGVHARGRRRGRGERRRRVGSDPDHQQ